MKKKVLIVEDELPIAEAEKLILQDLYEVHHAKDGKEGWEKAKELKPHLIVLDLMLPERGGYDLCFNLRQHEDLKSTKVLMVSALAQNIDKSKGELVGTDAYLTKPFEPEQLLEHVNNLLQ